MKYLIICVALTGCCSGNEQQSSVPTTTPEILKDEKKIDSLGKVKDAVPDKYKPLERDSFWTKFESKHK
jgi:hypothetical protein